MPQIKENPRSPKFTCIHSACRGLECVSKSSPQIRSPLSVTLASTIKPNQTMPFVNEIATEQDIVKYGLAEQDREFFRFGGSGGALLTIDREKNTYLRHMTWDGREDPVTDTFIFFWRGTRVDLVLATVYFSTIRREYLEQTVKIWNTCPPTNSFWLPDALEPRRQDIIADFKAAIIARRGIVASGEYEVCKFNFEF